MSKARRIVVIAAVVLACTCACWAVARGKRPSVPASGSDAWVSQFTIPARAFKVTRSMDGLDGAVWVIAADRGDARIRVSVCRGTTGLPDPGQPLGETSAIARSGQIGRPVTVEYGRVIVSPLYPLTSMPHGYDAETDWTAGLYINQSGASVVDVRARKVSFHIDCRLNPGRSYWLVVSPEWPDGDLTTGANAEPGSRSLQRYVLLRGASETADDGCGAVRLLGDAVRLVDYLPVGRRWHDDGWRGPRGWRAIWYDGGGLDVSLRPSRAGRR